MLMVLTLILIFILRSVLRELHAAYREHWWGTILDTHSEKPSRVAILDTLKPMCLAPNTIPCSKHFNIFFLAHSPPEWARTQSMPQLSQVEKSFFKLSPPFHLH
jgi:hypothetical protein